MPRRPQAPEHALATVSAQLDTVSKLTSGDPLTLQISKPCVQRLGLPQRDHARGGGAPLPPKRPANPRHMPAPVSGSLSQTPSLRNSTAGAPSTCRSRATQRLSCSLRARGCGVHPARQVLRRHRRIAKCDFISRNMINELMHKKRSQLRVATELLPPITARAFHLTRGLARGWDTLGGAASISKSASIVTGPARLGHLSSLDPLEEGRLPKHRKEAKLSNA